MLKYYTLKPPKKNCEILTVGNKCLGKPPERWKNSISWYPYEARYA
jgi:hypothetical protein